MAANVFRLKLIVIATIAISFAIVLSAPSPVVPANTYPVDDSGIPILIQDISDIPQPLIDDASEVATDLFGNSEEKCRDFVSQLLNIYLAAKDKDVIIIFNSGGFGWTPIVEAPDKQEFFKGIEFKVNALGYSSLLLNHFRTEKTLNGYLSEFMAEVGFYPSKAVDLATRVEFLTKHIPGIKVILAGESNGTGICERVMQILQENTQVYSIQLGPPFWSKGLLSDRSLVLRSNGKIPDTFSHGDLITIIHANIETLFGISQDNPGNILFYIGAPGHDYSWEYEEVRSQVIKYLDRWLENYS